MSLKSRLAAAAAVVALGAPAMAQQSAQQQAQANQEAQAIGLEEIVVTAQRRETRLQDTPVAVTALSELQIERGQFTESLDLGRIVPNLIAINNVTLGASNTYFLRGIGSTESIATFDPPVGTYVDDVFVARQNANNIELFEVERIEVLRGPQGTLFGRNTTGGAISIITKKPSDEFNANFEASYGRYDEVRFKGLVNVPLSDKVYTSVSAYYVKDDGWQESVRTGEKFNFIDAYGVRGAVRVVPSDNITWDFSGDWQTQDHQNLASIVDPARAATNIKAGKSGPWVLGSGLKNDVYLRNCKTGAGPLQWVRNGCTANEVTGYNLYSNIAVDVGDSLTFNIITGYRNLDHDFVSPLFASLRAGFELPLSNAGNHNQFSNEIKLNGELADGKLRYTTGLFYMKEDNLTRYETSLAAPPAHVFLVLDDSNLENDTESFAWYAQAEYDIDKLTLIAGVRWTDEKKTLKSFTHGGVNGVFNLGNVAAAGIPTAVSAVVWTPKGVIQYNVNDDVMFYVSATRGFKSGGWNARASAADRLTRFNEETVWSYEIGTRAEFMDNRVRTNITGFSATYSDLQLPALLRTPAVGEAPIFVTDNAGKSRVRGVEFEGTALITEGLTGTLTFGIQKGKYLELGPRVTAGGFSLDDETDRTPDFTSNVGLTYETPIAMGGSVVLTADYQHVSDFAGNGQNNPENANPGFDTVNASIGWNSEDERWGVSLGCKNCTDERIIGTHFLNARFLQDPLRWSLRFKFNYN